MIGSIKLKTILKSGFPCSFYLMEALRRNASAC